MEINRIRPNDPNTLEYLIAWIKAGFDKLNYNADVFKVGKDIKVIDVRLKELVPNTLRYERDPNWSIGENDKGEVMAYNVSGYEHEIKRARYLQYEDWSKVNDMLNKVCDMLKVECNIRSLGKLIREGNKQLYPEQLYFKGIPRTTKEKGLISGQELYDKSDANAPTPLKPNWIVKD